MKLRKNYYGIMTEDGNKFQELWTDGWDGSTVLHSTKKAAKEHADEVVDCEEFNTKKQIVAKAIPVRMTLQVA